MFCPYCGNEILVKNAKFCFQCGSQIPDFSIENKVVQDTPQINEEIEECKKAESEIEDTGIDEERNLPDCIEVNYEVKPLIGYAGDDMAVQVPLFDEERRNHYEAYLRGTEYVFPIGNYEVRYRKDCIVFTNVISYFYGVRITALAELKSYYKANVRNMEDWIKKGAEKTVSLMSWMQKKAQNLLIASQIYGYSTEWLEKMIDMSTFSERIEAILGKYAEVCENEEQVRLMRELAKGSSSRRYVGGGFGFSGAMGGIMAAGVANAGAGVARGIKSGITAIGDGMRSSANKREVFENPETYAVLEDMLKYQEVSLIRLCMEIFDRESGFSHSIYLGREESKMLMVHAREYAESENEFWADLIKAWELWAYNPEIYKTIYEKYYKDLLLMSQLKEIYRFFLLDYIEQDITKLYQNEMQQMLDMPEGTIYEVEQKIQGITQKSEEFKMNMQEEIIRLENLLTELRINEAERKKYLAMLEENVKIADKVEELMMARDFPGVFQMMQEDSMIAEERYIAYYIEKIREEENVKLYNSIASNALKHRAYLCIVGICSYHGWGTEESIELAKQCILKSAGLNCSYAKAYICTLYLQELEEFAEETQIEEYENELSSCGSPIALYYYGKALSSGAQKGGSDFMENDYQTAVIYLEYAAKCHIKGAEKCLASVKKTGEEKINAETYNNSGGCYITTAVCRCLQKKDDCYELTMFRNYRDEILSKETDGRLIIREYYNIAPRIVENIDQRCNSKKIYQMIWDNYLKQCLQYIECKNYSNCKDLYMQMVRELQSTYL